MTGYRNSCEIICVIRTRKTNCCLQCIYAGLIVFLVPSVLCDSDKYKALSYSAIFNSTSYAQLRNPSRPYDIPSLHSFSNNHIDNSHSFEEEFANELDYRDNENDKNNEVPLLVGFARDPFRYSVPEKDYLNGVRHINPQSYGKNEYRGKRGVVHLYNMMYCATGCEPLAYKGYGCYCGFLGSGRPTDGIDRCCKMHDECYENIYCPFFTVYFQPYYWKCYRGQPLCAIENYHTQHQFINGCAGRLCECDRRFAMCVKKYSCPRSRALCKSSPIRLLQNLLMFR